MIYSLTTPVKRKVRKNLVSFLFPIFLGRDLSFIMAKGCCSMVKNIFIVGKIPRTISQTIPPHGGS